MLRNVELQPLPEERVGLLLAHVLRPKEQQGAKKSRSDVASRFCMGLYAVFVG